MNASHQIIQNIGNFSEEVLPGMIAYGREQEKGRGKLGASNDLPDGDGYATREADIQLGGFLYVQAAKAASEQGKSFSQASVHDKQSIALKLCQEHIARFGSSNLESHKKWLKRVQAYARHHHRQLPAKGNRETTYDYARRLQKWTQQQPGTWPRRRPAVGTHLILSPEPRYWKELRAAGVDERQFLHAVLSQTMKDFADWRRQQYGHGRTLGWVAGTHVHLNGSDRHPHIHLVVLKRDQQGKDVDWSVNTLKGRSGHRQNPDPLRAIKHFFERRVEKTYTRHTQPRLAFSPETKLHERSPATRSHPRLLQLGRQFRIVVRAMHPFLRPGRTGNGIGVMLRMVSRMQQIARSRPVHADERQMTFANLRASIAAMQAQSPQLQPGD
jgi:hypothetical protein